ncbi:hypothetical protein PGT21_034329 [Puccinia graminis f. sp. tritici]|uniref:Uncharacterized protein n=1 Tax=Puccinia graminis f. sp. tritici TaxID=56615 RepID=A0A5B0QDB9_PUCGR|nr:hypothetical protein PGT21_034329 [Puccinia graminis f. sp. tritici]
MDQNYHWNRFEYLFLKFASPIKNSSVVIIGIEFPGFTFLFLNTFILQLPESLPLALVPTFFLNLINLHPLILAFILSLYIPRPVHHDLFVFI